MAGRAVGAAVVLTLLLRVPFAPLPLGIDEGGLAYVASHWERGAGSLYGTLWLDRPPLLLALFRLAEAGAELGIRALGALAAIGLVSLVAGVARALAGDLAAATAAVLAAALGGSVALLAAYTPAELLAAVPSTAAVLCLVQAHLGGRDRWLFAAGVLAGTALLIKQSAVDAALVGAVLVVLSARRDGRLAGRVLALLGGLAVALAALLAWQLLAGHPPGALAYALVGFRVDAIPALAATDAPLDERLGRLVPAALGSALFLVAPLAVAGVVALRRRDPIMAWAAAAWLLAGAVAVVAGGSYWAHYLIQLVPACSVLAAVALARVGRRPAVAVAAVVVATVAGVNAVKAVRHHEGAPKALELSMTRFVRDHARPGDTQYVMYARANVLWYVDLPMDYPYAWSLMLQTFPDASERLQRLLASGRRPTWILQWQHPNAWGLDPTGRTLALMRAHYRQAAPSFCGTRTQVLLRRDERRVVGRPRVCPDVQEASAGTPTGSS